MQKKITFGGKLTLLSWKMVIFYTPTFKLKLVAILSMPWGFPLIHVAVPLSSVSQVLFIILGSKLPYLHREVSSESFNKIWRGNDPPELKNGVFYIPSCPTEGGSHIVMISLSGNPLGTGNHDFCTHQYQLCNMDFPVNFAQTCQGRRIMIPRCECTLQKNMAVKCDMFMTCSKTLIDIGKVWLPNMEHLMDYRCGGKSMAYECKIFQAVKITLHGY